jgi:hypothetical protein
MLLLALGCGPSSGLYLRVGAPLRIPEDCDGLSVQVKKGSAVLFEHRYALSNKLEFPVTLNLVTDSTADEQQPLALTVKALHGTGLAAPWSTRTVPVSLVHHQVTPLDVKLCDCAP